MRRIAVVATAVIVGGVGMAGPVRAADVTISSGPLTAIVTLDPFAVSFAMDGAEVLASSEPIALVSPGALGFSVIGGAEAHQLGYSLDVNASAWFHATTATQVTPNRFEVATTDPLGRAFTVDILDHAPGVIAVEATLSDASVVGLTGAAFVLGADEHTVGFGERSDAVDQAGRIVTNWNEEG
ncbi:MAG: hypothetical protein R3249_08560, partial [Nitriliruptorales bacterium]|nr:hypothetical protein [Nitriliruptorales bacterium]